MSQLSAAQESSQHQRAVLSAGLQASAALSPPERRELSEKSSLCQRGRAGRMNHDYPLKSRNAFILLSVLFKNLTLKALHAEAVRAAPTVTVT